MNDMTPYSLPWISVTFATLRAGYQVSYPVIVDDKEIITRGEVFSVRRVAHNRAEITLLHAKTGALMVNIVKANRPVRVYSAMFTEGDSFAVAMKDVVRQQLTQQQKDFYSAPIAR